MIWFSLAKMALKTGSHIYQNRQRTKAFMSDAQLRHAEKMAQGQIEYSGKILENHFLIGTAVILVMLVYKIYQVIRLCTSKMVRWI